MTITSQLILRAYAAGLFPMAESRAHKRLFWVDPDRRGILPLDAFHLPRRLARTIRAGIFEVRVDFDFAATLHACGEPTHDRPETWINAEIEALYGELHRLGFAHSVECWREGALVGGLYGVALGGAFFGESMFSRVRDSSKVALAHLVAILIGGGFRLLDTQFVTDHLSRFGAREIPRAEYRRLLALALDVKAEFQGGLAPPEVLTLLQSSTQTS